MVLRGGASPLASIVARPESPPLPLFNRHFESFPTPDAMDAFAVNAPALASKYRGDAPVTVARIECRQFEDSVAQPLTLVIRARLLTMRGARAGEGFAGATLRDLQSLDDVENSPPPALAGLEVSPRHLLEN